MKLTFEDLKELPHSLNTDIVVKNYLDETDYDEKRRRLDLGDFIIFSRFSNPDEKIAVKVKDIGNNNTLTSVEASGILCIMFDRDALGINNYNYRVRRHVNNRAEFTNHWYKVDARYFNDENENFVVFFMA